MAHHTKLATKAFWCVGWLALASIIYMVGLLIYWQIQPYQLPYIKEPIKILNEDHEIAIGEPIRMEVEVRKPYPTHVINQTPRIECDSGNLVTLVGRPADLPVGEYTITSDSYLLPPKVLVGETCRFYFQTTFQVNPIKTVQQDWSSEPFTVVEAR